MISAAVVCAAMMNFALSVSSKEGIIPLADAAPYGELLGAKYARAMKKLDSARGRIQITDLSFAIFDELVPGERLERMTFKEVISYRKESEAAREHFLEHLGVLQARHASDADNGDYPGAVKTIIEAEILPAARVLRNKLQTIDESLYGTLAKGALAGAVTAAAGVSFFWGSVLGEAHCSCWPCRDLCREGCH